MAYLMLLSRLLSLSLFVLIAGTLASCGGDTETIRVKDYRLAVLHDDPAIKREFQYLISEFNQNAGEPVLKYVDDPRHANSAVIVTKGLEERDGKVGWGQWLSETEEDGSFLSSTSERRVTYSMRLEFDEDYLRTRMNETTRKNTTEKQKLFFHEVGHGLEMDHSPTKSDLMYYDISGDKNFDVFFQRVRSYMRSN